MYRFTSGHLLQPVRDLSNFVDFALNQLRLNFSAEHQSQLTRLYSKNEAIQVDANNLESILRFYQLHRCQDNFDEIILTK